MNHIYSASRFCGGNGNDDIFKDGGRDSIDVSDDRTDCDDGIDDGVTFVMVVILMVMEEILVILMME